MIGMLVGMAALSAFGLYRFQQHLQEFLQRQPKARGFQAALQLQESYRKAFEAEYSEIFMVTAILCVLGAVLALFITSRHTHHDDDAGLEEPAEPLPSPR